MLDSINLPTQAKELSRFIERSRASFRGDAPRRRDGVYVFVAQDTSMGRVVGTSLVIAKHGTPESPHFYLDMDADERYSRTLKKLVRHSYLTLRHSMDGPTEVGGLIVDPALRKHRAGVGKQLSFVRFLYMAMHRRRFEDEVIAEMMPRLTDKGESPFWECYGKRITGLGFREADKLSIKDKEFIDALFPPGPLYVCLLPPEVQASIGTVRPETEWALRLLEKIGLHFLGQVDPFDAGPYYGGRVADTALVKAFRRCRAQALDGSDQAAPLEDVLVGWEAAGGFRAARVCGKCSGRTLSLPKETLAALALKEGTELGVVPFL